MTKSLDRIERTIIALRAGLPLPKDLAQWLDNGLVARTEGESLDSALGLTQAGQLLPETQARYKARDQYLREAFALISGDQLWHRIEEFSKQIRRFESINWLRDQYLDEPPEIYTPMKKKLFEAFNVGIGVPSSTSRLYLLLSDNVIHKSKSSV